MRKLYLSAVAVFAFCAASAQCPTITLGANPTFCNGGTYVTISFSTTSGSPNEYRVDWDAAANAAGVADFGPFPIGPGPSYIHTKDATSFTSTISGQLFVKNTSSGCESAGYNIQAIVNPFPSIVVSNPSPVCSGATSVNIGLSPVNGANQYMIDWISSLADIPWTTIPGGPLTISTTSLSPGNYVGVVYARNTVTGCETSTGTASISIIETPTVTMGTMPTVCWVSLASIQVTVATGYLNQHKIDWDASANAAGFTDYTSNPSSAIGPGTVVTVFQGSYGHNPPAGVYTGTYYAQYNYGGIICENGYPISITVNPKPNFTVPGTVELCSGTTSTSLPYSNVVGAPNQYSIAWTTYGMVNLPPTSLPPGSIPITGLPTTPGTYSGFIMLENTITGCSNISPYPAFSIVINPVPSIAITSINNVCGATVNYSSTGSPNQYRIDWNAAANTAGMADVALTTLPAGQITVSGFPPLTPNTFNGTLYVRNVGGCESTGTPITIQTPAPCINDFNPKQAVPGTTMVVTGTGFSPNPSENILYVGSYLATVTASTTTSLTTTVPLDAITGGVYLEWNGQVIPAYQIFVRPYIVNTQGCNGGTVQLSTNTLSTGAVTYSVTNGTGGASVVGSNLYGGWDGTVTVTANIAAAGVFNAVTFSQQLTIVPRPSISISALPSPICPRSSLIIAYSNPTMSPTQYMIDWHGFPISGLPDVPWTFLPSNQIPINSTPSPAGTYTGTLYVSNSLGTGCATSVSPGLSLTVLTGPTISGTWVAPACTGTSNTTLSYSGTTGTPSEYRIDWFAPANSAGMPDVSLTGLPASPILIQNLPSAPATYGGHLFVKNTTTGCESNSSVIINPTVLPATAITVHPSTTNRTSCQNLSLPALTITATGPGTGGTFTYQWYSNTTASTSGGTLVSGATSASFAPPTNVANIRYYYATATGCSTATSSVSGSQTVNPSTASTIHPAPSGQNECQNVTPTPLTVAATGTGTVTYQWYWRTSAGNSGGTLISGANATSYSPPVTTLGTRYYYATASATCGPTVPSNSSGPVVVASPTSITQHPSTTPQTVCQNAATTSLTVTATGTGLTYQWYSNTSSSNTGGTLISGATTSTHTPQSTVANVRYYYVIVTGSCGSSTSNVSGAITINPATAITANPSSATQTVCQNGATTPLTVTAIGTGTLNYQWYSNSSPVNSGGTTVGTNSPSYTPPSTTAGVRYYYVIVSSSCGGPIPSNVSGAITINPTTVITVHPNTTPQSVCLSGSVPPLTVTAIGVGLSFQWYSNTAANNTGGSIIGGALTTSYTPPSNTVGTKYYYVVVSGTCGSSVTSNVSGAITVNLTTAITAHPSTGSQNVCPTGSLTSLSVTATGANLSYQWYSNTTQSNSGGMATGVTTSTFLPPITTAGVNYYYAVVTGSCGTVTSSPSGPITVNQVWGTISAGSNICDGPVLLTAGMGIFWQWGGIASGQSQQAWVYSGGTASVSYSMGNGCPAYGEIYLDDQNCEGGGHGCEICPRKNTGYEDKPKEQSLAPFDEDYLLGVYPNPANDEVRIVLSEPAKHDSPVMFYDVLGRLSKEAVIPIGKKSKTISVADMQVGMYVVDIMDNGVARQQKLIIRRE